MRPNLVTGLDIGSTKTCAVIAEVGMDDATQPSSVKILGVGQARTGGMRRDVVTDIEGTMNSVRAAVKEAELMAGVTVDRVWVGTAGEHVHATTSTGVVAVGSDREIRDNDVRRVHEVARAVAIPADRELLHAQHPERSRGHAVPPVLAARTSVRVRSPGRGAFTKIAMLPLGWWLSRIN